MQEKVELRRREREEGYDPKAEWRARWHRQMNLSILLLMLAVAASSVAGKTFLLSLSESADKKDVVKDVEALGGSVQEYFKLLPLVLLVELPDGQVTTLG